MNNKTNEEVQGVLESMRELGLRVDTGGVSRDLISRNLDLDSQLPGNLIHQVLFYLKQDLVITKYCQVRWFWFKVKFKYLKGLNVLCLFQLKREVPMISYTQLNNNIIAELLNRADPRYLKVS